MKKEKLTSPYDLVARALECDKDSLNEESGILNHPKWESLTHVAVIVEIEQAYNMEIADQDVMRYDNMKSIIDLYNKLAAEG
jgi:acyl carrier protein